MSFDSASLWLSFWLFVSFLHLCVCSTLSERSSPLVQGDEGMAKEYISRSRAVRKLQLSLADFRRLCILKGVYPREPPSRKKVSGGSTANRTYYFTKDINWLLHEPLLQKFRDFKVWPPFSPVL